MQYNCFEFCPISECWAHTDVHVNICRPEAFLWVRESWSCPAGKLVQFVKTEMEALKTTTRCGCYAVKTVRPCKKWEWRKFGSSFVFRWLFFCLLKGYTPRRAFQFSPWTGNSFDFHKWQVPPRSAVDDEYAYGQIHSQEIRNFTGLRGVPCLPCLLVVYSVGKPGKLSISIYSETDLHNSSLHSLCWDCDITCPAFQPLSYSPGQMHRTWYSTALDGVS